MDRTDIVESNADTIAKARKLQEMLKSDGYKIRQEIVARKKQALVDAMFKSEINVKKHEYNRGAVNFQEEVEEEIQGMIDDAQTAQDNIDALDR